MEKEVFIIMSETIVMNDLPHWEKVSKFGKIKYMCSKCRKLIETNNIGERNFCSWCGVQMAYIKL